MGVKFWHDNYGHGLASQAQAKNDNFHQILRFSWQQQIQKKIKAFKYYAEKKNIFLTEWIDILI